MLQKLQNSFLDALNQTDPPFLLHIQPNAKVAPATQFSIYQNSILVRFQRALKDIYPVCQQLVGDEFFLAMASHYIGNTNSRSADLNDYGADFADFIDNFPPARSLPYLGDVARLEWAWHRIAGATDQNSFDFVKLAACYEQAGEALVFTLPSRCTLLASPYPVHSIWEINQKNYQGNDSISLSDGEQYYFFIWRDQYELRIDILTTLQWHILGLLKQEIALGRICEQAADIDASLDVPALFATWVQSGWIAGFSNPVDVTTNPVSDTANKISIP